MPKSNKFARMKGAEKDALDASLPPYKRLLAVAQFLRVSNDKIRTPAFARRILKELSANPDLTPKESKKLASIRELLRTGRWLSESAEDAPVFDAAEFPVIPIEERLRLLNKDIFSPTTPQKFFYFPVDDRGAYLKKTFPAVFITRIEATIKEIEARNPGSLGSPTDSRDPFDWFELIPGKKILRGLNPNFCDAFLAWKKERIGDDLPSMSSTWFLRFCSEEETKNLRGIGAINIPAEQPSGYELRRREHVSGFLKQHETAFVWELWGQILVGNATITEIEMPEFYQHEFDEVAVEGAEG